ncbi:biotin--[acetyl-CoA-carboxylase] ligase [Commensalibacter communis]|uniref:biotin--[acetyl-CoA-carboxylase] ligase n=1 Tax=Commensalibacter communis TaxID=2972786 RepID=UPI0022FF9F84|nr:biotin--[acetyl-CoA-carboxylase] ligase [Commensalibacter communis]CAI3933105.1 Biotin-(acetyl-CoA carboxylase) ligase (BirA2) (PDB:1BIA) (PUBMED:32188788) [Commensalibacter communis]CAI3945084.1 Biotin-(acetyl-CoA carboxylase) ligase (BirA2) (PDB:1BIA) (PUBMED:32188788) [Commensalibacter communis]
MDNKITWQVEHYPTLPSTNDYCIEQARLKEKINLAVLTDSQTAPRGSRGREWVEPTGNLALSFLYWPSFSVEKIGWVPFISSLALFDAVTELCGTYSDLYIKWPNDLLFQNKKIAGILIESHVEYPNVLEWFVIGIGLNICSAPMVEGRELGCLKDFVSDELPSPLLIADKIRQYLSYWISRLDQGQEQFIRESWLQKGLPLGRSLTVTSGNEKYIGIYKGIDEKGFLLLQTETSLKQLSAGELFCLYESRNE